MGLKEKVSPEAAKGEEPRGGNIPELAHLLPGQQDALLGGAGLGPQHLQLHLQLRGDSVVSSTGPWSPPSPGTQGWPPPLREAPTLPDPAVVQL